MGDYKRVKCSTCGVENIVAIASSNILLDCISCAFIKESELSNKGLLFPISSERELEDDKER